LVTIAFSPLIPVGITTNHIILLTQ
jgi:hypothetical protein